MSQFDSNKDYYGVLGVDKEASQIDIERQYKREASKHHPDRGGSEERMKSLNEAYGVLKDETMRDSYDATRHRPGAPQGFIRVTTPIEAAVGAGIGPSRTGTVALAVRGLPGRAAVLG